MLGINIYILCIWIAQGVVAAVCFLYHTNREAKILFLLYVCCWAMLMFELITKVVESAGGV